MLLKQTLHFIATAQNRSYHLGANYVYLPLQLPQSFERQIRIYVHSKLLSLYQAQRIRKPMRLSAQYIF